MSIKIIFIVLIFASALASTSSRPLRESEKQVQDSVQVKMKGRIDLYQKQIKQNDETILQLQKSNERLIGAILGLQEFVKPDSIKN